jgi:autotransporter-associated beta strand protein
MVSGNFNIRTGVVRRLRAVLLASTALCGASALPAVAQDATWSSTPGSGDFNTAANWTPAAVPTGTAYFGVSGTTALTFSANTSVGGWTFNSPSSAYSFTNSGQLLSFTGAGIIGGGSTTIANSGGIYFQNNSTAGSAAITSSNNLVFVGGSTAGSAAIVNNSQLGFYDTSTAGSASITNSGGGQLSLGDTATAGSASITNNGSMYFNNSSTAGTAGITSNNIINFYDSSTAGAATITNSGNLNFNDSSTAGSASITNTDTVQFNNSSTAGSASIVNTSVIIFDNSSNAGTARITNNGGAVDFNGTSSAANATIVNNALLRFFANSTAGSATITNNSDLLFTANSTAGNATITNTSQLTFDTNSRAGNATIINNGNVLFDSNSTPDNAQLINTAPGAVINFFTSGLNSDGRISAGSIAGNGRFDLNSAELTVGGNNLSTDVTGVLTGDGLATGTSLIKTGTGTLTLSGTNTYTGDTIVNGGTLQIGNGGTTGSIAGSVTVNAGATFAVNRSDNLTLTNNVGGAGGFAQNGTGTTTFAQAFAYTGGTTVNAGTLLMSGAGTLGATSGTTRVNTGGTLNLGGTTQTQNGGVVIGGGTITNGTLRSSSLFDAQGGTVSAILAGTANLVASTGNTILRAINTYTGTTTVNSGRLEIASGGSINSAVTVNGGTFVNNGASLGATTINSGGTLGGNGTFGNTTINGGTLSPGNSIGTLTIQGNLVLTSASTYMVEVDPTGADRTNVTGTATLGGAGVRASFASGSYVSRRYTILNAQGGVSGTFNSVVNTNLPSNFTSALAYDANNAYLDLTLNFTPTPTPPPPGGPSAPTFAPLTVNQRNVADGLINSFNTAGGIPFVFGALSATGLTQVSGEHATGTQQTTFDAMDKFVNVLTDPFMGTRAGGAPEMAASGYADDDESLAYAAKRKRTGAEREAYAAFKTPPKAVPFERRWSVWGAGYGGTQQTDGNGGVGSQKFTNHVYGSAAGFDYRLTPETLVGFALGGAGTTFGLANGLGGGRSEVFQGGVYGRHTSGPAYVSGALAWGWQDITTNRTVFANGYRANFDANAITGRLEGGWRFAYGTSGITPYAAGQVTSFFLPGYAETLVAGANTFALAYSGKDVTASRSELGLRGDTSFALADAIVTLRGRAAWAHNFNTDRSISALFQTLPASGFTVFGASPARDSALVTASAETKWLNGFSVAATFEGEFSNVTESYAGKGMVRYQW